MDPRIMFAHLADTRTPVTYHKGPAKIATGTFDGKYVACLIWTEDLAKKAVQAYLSKPRLERARREYDNRRRWLVGHERMWKREV